MDAETAGLFVRSLVTGDRSGLPADLEARAQSVGTAGKGGYAVPTPVSSTILDMVTARMAVREARASVIPFTAQTISIPKVTGRPAPAWRAEAAALAGSDLTIGSVPFDAQSLGVLVKMSVEVEADAPQVGRTVADAITTAMALELDRVSLFGSGSGNEPTGLVTAHGVDTYLGAADGAAITWADLVAAKLAVAGADYSPGAAIMAQRTDAELGSTFDASSGWVTRPPYLEGLDLLATSQVPTDEARGSSTDPSKVIVGEFAHLAIGVRQDLTILPIRESFLDTGHVALVAFLRADVAVMRDDAFHVTGGVVAA